MSLRMSLPGRLCQYLFYKRRYKFLYRALAVGHMYQGLYRENVIVRTPYCGEICAGSDEEAVARLLKQLPCVWDGYVVDRWQITNLCCRMWYDKERVEDHVWTGSERLEEGFIRTITFHVLVVDMFDKVIETLAIRHKAFTINDAFVFCINKLARRGLAAKHFVIDTIEITGEESL